MGIEILKDCWFHLGKTNQLTNIASRPESLELMLQNRVRILSNWRHAVKGRRGGDPDSDIKSLEKLLPTRRV